MLSHRFQSSDAVTAGNWRCVSDAPPPRMILTCADEAPAPAREAVREEPLAAPASFVLHSWEIADEASLPIRVAILRAAPAPAPAPGLLVSGLIDFLHSYGLLFGSAAGFQDDRLAWRGRPNLSHPARRAHRKLRKAHPAGSFLSGVTNLLVPHLTAPPSLSPV